MLRLAPLLSQHADTTLTRYFALPVVLPFFNPDPGVVKQGVSFAGIRYIGITSMVVLQALMNISVVLGMMPTKGIPLPLISSGGSSLLVTLASIGVLLNITRQTE